MFSERKQPSNFREEFQERLLKYSLKIVNYCRELENDRILRPISQQLIRSATSIGANIVEAGGASSAKDYLHYFEISLKSANETKYWLLLAKEVEKKSCSAEKDIYLETEELTRIIASSILTMKGKRKY